MQIIAVDIFLKRWKAQQPKQTDFNTLYTRLEMKEAYRHPRVKKKEGEATPGWGSRRYNKRRGSDKVCAGRHPEIREVKTCEVRRSHRCGHSVCSVIDLVFVGVQAFGGVQVIAEVLGCFLHCFQLARVRSGPSKECPLCEGNGFATIVILLLESFVGVYIVGVRDDFWHQHARGALESSSLTFSSSSS